MKKKLFSCSFFVSLLCSFFLMSCSDDEKENYINEQDLPEVVGSFLQEYLPNNKFVSAIENGAIYTIQLEGGIEVVMPQVGAEAWLSIDAKTGLPKTLLTLLTSESQKILSEKYADEKVIHLSKQYENDAYKLMLESKKQLKEMLVYESYTIAEVLEGDALNTLPQKTKEFITKYLGAAERMSPPVDRKPIVYKYSNFRGDVYRIFFGIARAYIEFYQDGEWFYMLNLDTSEAIVENIFLKELPNDMLSVLTAKHSDIKSSLRSINRYNDNKYYGFTLKDKSFTVINSANKIVEAPLEKAKQIVEEGFKPAKELKYEIIPNTATPFFLRFAFVTTGDHEVRMATDVEGNLRNISAGPIVSNGEGVVPLPKEVLEMFPSKIMDYLVEHNATNRILSISHSYSVSQNDTADEVNLTMLIPNNFKELIFDSKTGDFLREYNVIEKE